MLNEKKTKEQKSFEQHLRDLVDRRLEVQTMQKTLDEELKAIDEVLKSECEIGEFLLGTEGHGYRITSQTKLTYGSPAVAYLEKKGLLSEFASVTTTKLEALRKAGKLTGADIDHVQKFATEKVTPTIVRFVPEEAKVF